MISYIIHTFDYFIRRNWEDTFARIISSHVSSILFTVDGDWRRRRNKWKKHLVFIARWYIPGFTRLLAVLRRAPFPTTLNCSCDNRGKRLERAVKARTRNGKFTLNGSWVVSYRRSSQSIFLFSILFSFFFYITRYDGFRSIFFMVFKR